MALVTIEEFAKLARHFKPCTIREYCVKGRLPAGKIGRRWFIDDNKGMAALRAMMTRREQEVVAPLSTRSAAQPLPDWAKKLKNKAG